MNRRSLAQQMALKRLGGIHTTHQVQLQVRDEGLGRGLLGGSTRHSGVGPASSGERHTAMSFRLIGHDMGSGLVGGDRIAHKVLRFLC